MKEENKEPIVIGKLKEDKQKGPLVVFVIMIVLIAVVIFLPDIKNLIEKENIPSSGKSVNPIVNGEKDKEVEKSEMYALANELVIKYLDMSFSNINKETNRISFTIQNNRKKDLLLNEESLYIELYNGSQTLLERIKVYDYQTIVISATKELSFQTTNDLASASLIKIVQIEPIGYPSISLTENEAKESALTCVLDGNELTYSFVEDKLVKIKDVYKYTNELNLEEYSNKLMEYKNKAEELNKIVGITSIVTESNLNFIFNTELDLKSANISNLKNVVYFTKDVSSKEVAFEMNAMRFDCK